MPGDAASSRTPQTANGWRSWYTLVLLFAVATSNYLDRSIITILQVPIKKDLGLSDAQLGAMTGLAFALCYTLLSLPAARLADRTSRKGVLAISVMLWSVTTIACGFATGFKTIFAARVGVAVGEAAGSPVSHALVADQFPVGRRSTAMALWSLAIPGGAMLGLGLGSWLNDILGWRHTFIIVGAAGALLSPLVYFTIRERVPARTANAPRRTSLGWADSVRILWNIKGFRYLCLGGMLHGFGIYAIYSWAAPFFNRVHGMPLTQVGLMLALMTGVGGAIGILGGGVLADILGRRSARWYLLVPALSAGLLGPVAAIEFLTPNLDLALGMGFVVGMLVHAHMGPSNSTVQSLVAEPMRAFSAAVFVMVSGLAGLSIAPLAIGIASDAMLARGLGPQSLGYAISSMMIFPVLAAISYFVGSRHVERELHQAGQDEAALEASRLVPA